MHSQENALPRFAGHVLESRRLGGQSPSSELLQVLTSWHAGTIPHESAVEAGVGIADSIDVSRTSRTQLELWERLCQISPGVIRS